MDFLVKWPHRIQSKSRLFYLCMWGKQIRKKNIASSRYASLILSPFWADEILEHTAAMVMATLNQTNHFAILHYFKLDISGKGASDKWVQKKNRKIIGRNMCCRIANMLSIIQPPEAKKSFQGIFCFVINCKDAGFKVFYVAEF